MGVELQPLFQPLVKDLVYNAEGKGVIDDLEALEAIAGEHSLTPLSTFMSPGSEDFEDATSPPPPAGDADTEWFPTQEGLQSVRGLLAALGEDADRDRLGDAETVIHDLEELARCLELAGTQGARFRLALA